MKSRGRKGRGEDRCHRIGRGGQLWGSPSKRGSQGIWISRDEVWRESFGRHLGEEKKIREERAKRALEKNKQIGSKIT